MSNRDTIHLKKRVPDGFKGSVNPTTHKPKTFTRNSEKPENLMTSY